MKKIAVLGYGVVGSGVCETIAENEARLGEAAGEPFKLGYVLEIRDCPDSPFRHLFAGDFEQIVGDPDVRVVAEVIGGTGIAYEFTKRALQAGKHVVTSNKELVAQHGAELLRLARDRGVYYLFEASVGGGIPIIRPLSRFLCSNRVMSILGILNGTCNYILTAMAEEHMDFADALARAGALGYAEQNPAADIDGHDTCRKICILASLAFGRHVYPKYIPTEGIRHVTAAHITEAKALGYRLKLLGRADSCADGRVQIRTAPYLVPENHPFYGVSDVFNSIMVTGHAAGEIVFTGKGAGRLSTASAVVSDILDCMSTANANRLFWQDSENDITLPYDSNDCKVHRFTDGITMDILPTNQQKEAEV